VNGPALGVAFGLPSQAPERSSQFSIFGSNRRSCPASPNGLRRGSLPLGAAARPSQAGFALSMACQGEVFQTASGLKNEDWWRWGESNPRPNRSHRNFYVRSRGLRDSPPPLPPDGATSVARILLVLAPPPGSPDLAPACCRRLYPLTGIRVETWRGYAASA